MGVFNRRKKTAITEAWFSELWIHILSKLPKEYTPYLAQVHEGIIRKVAKPGFLATTSMNMPNYIGVGYQSTIAAKYDELSGIDPVEIDKQNPGNCFWLFGAEVFNTRLNQYVEVELYFADGLICGINSDIQLNMTDFDNENIHIKTLTTKTHEQRFLYG